jgi:hypothetical protein
MPYDNVVLGGADADNLRLVIAKKQSILRSRDIAEFLLVPEIPVKAQGRARVPAATRVS